MKISRRDFAKSSLVTAATASVFSKFSVLAQAEEAGEEPHYFLGIIFEGGLNQMYFFDSRPVEMTSIGIAQNYTLNRNFRSNDPRVQAVAEKIPTLETDGAGNSSWVHPLAQAFYSKNRKDMAVINGIHMNHQSDGHEDSRRMHLNGVTSATTKEMIWEKLKYDKESLQILSNMDLAREFSKATLFSSSEFLSFSKAIANLLSVEKSSSEFPFLSKIYSSPDTRSVRYQRQYRMLLESLNQAPELKTKFKNTQDMSSLTDFDQMREYARLALSTNLSKVTLLSTLFNFDAHDTNTVERSLAGYLDYLEFLDGLIATLKSTECMLAPGKSLFDVTTVMASSEFNRGMRSDDIKKTGDWVFRSGTDHNKFGNSAWFFGKGIQGDRFIGGTDVDKFDKNNINVNFKDQDFGMFKGTNLVKNYVSRPGILSSSDSLERLSLNMGKPYFGKNDGSIYQPSKYITIQSVLNTMLALYKLPETSHVILPHEESAPRGPIIKDLLA